VKVAIFQSYLFGFRVPIFNKLNKKLSLTVFCDSYKKPVDDEILFEIKHSRLRKFYLWWQGLSNFNIKEYDAIILMLDAKIISNLWLLFLCKLYRKKVVCWGIGLGRSSTANKLRAFIVKFSDGVILYSKSARDEFVVLGVGNDKIHVANNTVDFKVEPSDLNLCKKKSGINYLFVGALEERKGLTELVTSFNNSAYYNTKLHIVGSGPVEQSVLSLITKFGLEDRIFMYGNVTNQIKLRELYDMCDFSISLRQAGLSVLQSFAFGRPFITYKDSITGGERDNIIDDNNGFLLGHNNRFENINEFFNAEFSKVEIERLFNNSRSTYDLSASPNKMVNIIYGAIK
tara:strand:+ start:8154 stop:9185 length:1032 start_codon:yes stop_codon:yes gene_type:complete